MAGTAVRGRLTWQVATVSSATEETASVRTLDLELPDWAGHEAGQHLDIRLTADDGYVAERSYSIASAPGEPVAITVERLDDGEVSPYLTEEVRSGDTFEIRGPIGGYFVWPGTDEGSPLLLLAGGSGVVPFRSILRHRRRIGSSAPVRLLYSARSLPDVIYRAELDSAEDGVEVIYTLTRQQPPGWTGHAGRVTDAHAARGRLAGQPAAGRVRLRAYGVRRDRGGGTGRSRLPAGPGQDRALRRSGRKLMDALDGNAIGGLLHEIFGAEMTDAAGTCASCGATRLVAEGVVYLRAPGTIMRCRNCSRYSWSVVRRSEMNCVDLSGLAALEPAPA